jgi:hypothetical protein
MRQVELFAAIDPPSVIPPAIEQEAFELLVQLMRTMIPAIEAEVLDEQDHD